MWPLSVMLGSRPPQNDAPVAAPPVLFDCSDSHVIVKNTFISLEDNNNEVRGSASRRTLSSPASSDRGSSELSSSRVGYWLPSFFKPILGDIKKRDLSTSHHHEVKEITQNLTRNEQEPGKHVKAKGPIEVSERKHGRSSREAKAVRNQDEPMHVKRPSKSLPQAVQALQLAEALQSLQVSQAEIAPPHHGSGSSSSQSAYPQSGNALPLAPQPEAAEKEEGVVPTSIGGLQHAGGDCVPCVYMSRGLCVRGADCNFCHFVHTDLKCKRTRPPKHVRERLKKRQAVNDAQASDEEPVLRVGL